MPPFLNPCSGGMNTWWFNAGASYAPGKYCVYHGANRTCDDPERYVVQGWDITKDFQRSGAGLDASCVLLIQSGTHVRTIESGWLAASGLGGSPLG
jgi:hypothetical protein